MDVTTPFQFASLGQPASGGTIFTPGLLMAAGVLVLILFSFRHMRKRWRPNQSNQMSPRERIEFAAHSTDARGRLESLMADVQDLTRLCAAQIDSKAARLEQLVAQADDRIRRLEQLQSGRDRPESNLDVEPVGVHGRNEWEGSQREHHSARVTTHAVRPKSSPLASRREALDPLTRKVYDLADAGHSSVDIARKLDEQVGKVDLILALREG